MYAQLKSVFNFPKKKILYFLLKYPKLWKLICQDLRNENIEN